MADDRIATAARVVADVAGHMQRLKSRALAMRDQFAIAEQGYFTPSQDEQVRHLLISYTQARNALYELLMTHRSDPDLNNPEDQRVFAVLYAAAIVLVDAARFMRDTWDDDPLVVRKLNEAEPAFGIAPGAYHRIQKSLTDPWHAWSLYKANGVYDRIMQNLLTDDDPQMARIMAVIHTLGGRVRVSPARYALARLKVRMRGLRHGLRDRTLGEAAYAVQEYGSRLVGQISVQPWHRPSLPDPVRDQLLGLMKCGDVIVTRKEHAATNYFLPGYWPHAALYIGTAEELGAMHAAQDIKPDAPPLTRHAAHRVIEALKDGVRLRTADSPFASDAVLVIRPLLEQEAINQAVKRGLRHIGKPYDFDFDFTRADRMVCTEVVYRSYEGIGPMAFKLTRRAGRLTLAAEDLLKMARNREQFEPVAGYCPLSGPHVQRGPAVDAVLDQTLRGVGVG